MARNMTCRFLLSLTLLGGIVSTVLGTLLLVAGTALKLKHQTDRLRGPWLESLALVSVRLPTPSYTPALIDLLPSLSPQNKL